MPGVFISKGMTLGIPAGGLTLTVDEDGKPTGNLTIHVHFDVCPTWLQLALQHLGAARERQVERVAAWANPDEEQRARSLESEFEASMQAIMASAIAMDALYAAVRRNVDLPEELVDTWRANRTARAAQVAEVLRLGFGLVGIGFRALRENLTEIYRLRDLAVHPSGEIAAPLLHPELNVGVEWRFAYFRHANAELIVKAAVGIVTELVTAGRPQNDEIRRYAATTRSRLAELQISRAHTARSLASRTQDAEA